MNINTDKLQNLDFIFSSIPIPLLVISKNLKILYINNFTESFLKKSSKNIIGKNLKEIIFLGDNILQLIIESLDNNFLLKERSMKVSLPNIGDSLVNLYFNKLNEYNDLGILLLEDLKIGKFTQHHNSRKNNLSLRGFSSLVSHEIKTPLSSISGAVQLLEANINKEDKKFIQIIRQETNRIVKLIDKMSLFDDNIENYFEIINIHDVLNNVIKVAKVGFGSSANFIEIYDPSLPKINGNKDSLVQLFTNLIKNSVESMNYNGDIIIKTSFNSDLQFKISERDNIKRSFLPIEVSIQDSGVGVPDDISDQIFNPFITSKFDGSGLGLPLALKIASDHNGTIEFNTKDSLTVFSVRLPLAKYNR